MVKVELQLVHTFMVYAGPSNPFPPQTATEPQGGLHVVFVGGDMGGGLRPSLLVFAFGLFGQN